MNEKEIKKVAEKFRADNGNKRIPDNDLLIYIMTKVDNLPCNTHIEKISYCASTIKQLKWIVGLLFSAIFALIFYLNS